MVVKLMSIRWAHVATKEWQFAQLLQGHPHILAYEQKALLHADTCKLIAGLLKTAREAGKLVEKKAMAFPERYICLFQEYMNRGSVQQCMDEDRLAPGGMFLVMQRVASALAYIHKQGLTHNDVKPENVLLSHLIEDNPRSEMLIKLADLGLVARSTDRSQDFYHYGMTVLCMTTGERFGVRKFQPEFAESFVQEIAGLIGDVQPNGRIGRTLAELPAWLRIIWRLEEEQPFAEIAEWPGLLGWRFFDGSAR